MPGAPKVGAVVFDLGGVLIDWDPRYLYRKIFDDEKAMTRFLLNVCTTDWNTELDRGLPFEEATSDLQARHPDWSREIRAYHDRWGEMIGGPIEGTVELLRALRDRRLPLYALTNWSAETFPIARSRFDFLDWFDDIVVSGEEGRVKPDRGIYDALIERTGLDPSKTVFIDDSKANVLAAEDLGFTGVLFRDGDELGEELVRLDLLPASSESRVPDAG